MTPKELENIISNMNEETFNEFVSKLPKDIAKVILLHRAFLKLFSDIDHYNAMKTAATEIIATQIFNQANEVKIDV